ncbi:MULTISPECIES: FKBP-type peptidyl-prolyl cis-trans isomerase [unclassified Nonomuraea]|uniref:FKBP-type peptidyl-prolyl cis-trans isomerase n=1 Tax=unclassified Nonomuraea TaxID=2593643 RepID=UPI0033E09CDE
MRRRTIVPSLAPLLLLAAGCTGATAGDLDLKVGGAFGARPTIVFPDGRPAAGLRVEELSTGGGDRLGDDDVAVVQYTAHVWDGRDNRLVDSSFNRGTPAAFPVGSLLPGLDRALRGRTVGSRVIAAIPPGEGFGTSPPRGVGPADDLFYVVDILGAHHKGASVKSAGGSLAGVRVTGDDRPELSIPSAAPPRAFASKVLRRGSGRPAQAGQLLVTQYEGAVWDRRRVFDGTWPTGLPKAFKIGDGTVIKGWDKALVGVPVGSRVLMIVPPAYGYGAPGHAAYGIKGSDTLVFVVDVLAAY